MAFSITQSPKSIQSLYKDYRDGLLIVNRKYQRKLIWSLEEKEKLIESIIKGYPIPLILLAQKDTANGSFYEIIDGMQRLHTIFGFIENSFSYDNKFFDIDEYPRAKRALDAKQFVPVIKASKEVQALSRELCTDFLDFEIPVTIYPNSNEKEINEIFYRINSFGKRLSNQERRHVLTNSPISNLVRKIASEIRNDSSEDIIVLYNMPEISINSPTSKLNYGINAEDVFWVKQGILNSKLLRESEDEQFIADIIASILGNTPFAASQDDFNDLYDPEKELHSKMNTALAIYGVEKIYKEIITVFSYIQDSVDAEGERNFLRGLFRNGDKRNPSKTEFYAFFMALFDLMIKKELTPINTEKIFQSLKNISENLEKASHYVTSEERIKNIGIVSGLIQTHFAKKDPSLLGHGPGLYLDLLNALKRSTVETSRYEFKQGILKLSDDRKIDENHIDNIVKLIRQ